MFVVQFKDDDGHWKQSIKYRVHGYESPAVFSQMADALDHIQYKRQHYRHIPYRIVQPVTSYIVHKVDLPKGDAECPTITSPPLTERTSSA